MISRLPGISVRTASDLWLVEASELDTQLIFREFINGEV
jgi:hypothetical protein